MPTNQPTTLEDINAAFAKLDLGNQQAMLARAAANPASLIPQICPIYQAVKKVLELVASLPFIPAAVKAGILAFIAAMNLICPAA